MPGDGASGEDPAIAIPVLASLDLIETERFYCDALGFAVERFDDYLIAKRDRMELHFALVSEPGQPAHSSCYIRGGQIVALYEEFRAKEVARLSDFAVRPWNMKEFIVHDPHGNLLRFGGAPEELDAL
jgi:catechol 2,3-dioxygenase-like lactoylglutathione lyase family enzyme